MVTILRMGNSEGERRCDATCHNASGSDCQCVCAGRYHGKGAQAQDMLTEDVLGDDWRERYGFPAEAEVGKVQTHLPLGDIERVEPAKRERVSRKPRSAVDQPRLAI